MPLTANNEVVHGPAKPTDPAHGASENTDHTTKSGEKPTTVVEAITDTSFIPTLDKAPLAQKIKSSLLLVFLVFGGVSTLWFFGFSLFETTPKAVEVPLAVPGAEDGLARSLIEEAKQAGLVTVGVSTVILALLYSTGTANVDFWSLVMEYGWWSLPVAGAMGLLFVMMQERTESIEAVV